VPASTKLVSSSATVSVRRIRVRGGHFKFRALRLDSGNFSWPSESITKKTRVLDVMYNASNNELVRPVPSSGRRRAREPARRIAPSPRVLAGGRAAASAPLARYGRPLPRRGASAGRMRPPSPAPARLFSSLTRLAAAARCARRRW